MTNDWILDVLADLRAFAEKNGLSVSEEQIDRTMMVVSKELATYRHSAVKAVQQDAYAGSLYRKTAER